MSALPPKADYRYENPADRRFAGTDLNMLTGGPVGLLRR